MKPVEWRTQARRDAAEWAYWYARQGGLALGEAFLADVDATLDIIARHPAVGATRHAGHVPDLPDHVEIVRLWHAARGLAELMEDGT